MTNAISTKNILTGNQPSLASKFLSMLEDARISPSDKSLSSLKLQAISRVPEPSNLSAKVISGHSDDWNITLHSNGDITLTERVNDGRGKPGEVITINKKDYSQIIFGDNEGYNIARFGFPSKGEPPVRISISHGADQSDKSDGLYRNEEKSKDTVFGGGGNDEFRTKGIMGGDFFMGGDGVDTLYLDGQKKDYSFEYFLNEDGYASIRVSHKNDPKNYMDIGFDVERLRFSDGGIDKGTDKRGFVKISEVMNIGYAEQNPFNLDLKTEFTSVSSVGGTQTNDFFSWSGIVTNVVEAGWGKDTLKLTGEFSDYEFEFKSADNNVNRKASLNIKNKETAETLVCYDLEYVTLPNGRTVSLTELKNLVEEQPQGTAKPKSQD